MSVGGPTRWPVLGLWLAGYWLAGCGVDTVRVTIELGSCDEQSALSALASADVVLKRDDNAKWVGGCSQAATPPGSIDELAGLLSRSFTFRDVPVGGRWTLAVKGYSGEACGQNSAVLCGRARNVTLPPPRGRITVSINCLPIYADIEDYKACIRE